MQHQIRTTLQHECSSPKPDKRRNERFWNRVEMLSEIWFFVEVCDREHKMQRWIATTIQQAVHIPEEFELANWSTIYVHIRAPSSIRSGTVFEVLAEAYQVGRKGAYIYKLANGLSFVTEPEGEQEVQKEPHQLRLLYARSR